MISREDLYKMLLHSTGKIDHQTIVQRVEGGWIYTYTLQLVVFNTSAGGYTTKHLNPTSTFVPEIKL
jgi:hypothetical protein